MSRLFYHTCQDNLGNLLFDVSGTMRLAGTGTAATIYGDAALTVPIPNPMTNHPSFGSFKCYLGAGSYDFYLAKAGYTFETLTGLQGGGGMANQEPNAVTITGGTVSATALYGLKLGVNAPNDTDTQVFVRHNKGAGTHGIRIQPDDADTGVGAEILFLNVSTVSVGAITTTATTTSYATTSDARLKHAVADLTGELAAVQALRPVKFKWNVDDSRGYGFIASEVQQVLPDANVITGTPDAVNEDGTINPQMIDYSRLVVWLVGACKTLAAQNAALQARLALLEDAVGV